jgi:non-ribosomal peptide synthase protein (TIGR01720 family)
MTSFKRWAERLVAYAASPELLAEAQYWLTAERGEVARLPLDRTDGLNLDRTAEYVDIALSVTETETLLQEVPKVQRTEPREAILAAVVLALVRWSGRRRVVVDLEGHGREDLFPEVNISRTVGWFTTVYPVLFDLPESMDAGAVLSEVRDRLRAVPAGGLGYGILRYLTGDSDTAESLGRQPAAEVVFNYRGQNDRAGGDDAHGAGEATAFGGASESPGRDLSPRALRSHLLEIDGGIENGELRLSWSYHPSFHHRTTIERLVQDFKSSLHAILLHCLSPEARETYRPADFPLARLDEENLRQLGTMLDELDEL